MPSTAVLVGAVQVERGADQVVGDAGAGQEPGHEHLQPLVDAVGGQRGVDRVDRGRAWPPAGRPSGGPRSRGPGAGTRRRPWSGRRSCRPARPGRGGPARRAESSRSAYQPSTSGPSGRGGPPVRRCRQAPRPGSPPPSRAPPQVGDEALDVPPGQAVDRRPQAAGRQSAIRPPSVTRAGAVVDGVHGSSVGRSGRRRPGRRERLGARRPRGRAGVAVGSTSRPADRFRP